jgi:ankyrin repeat protein
LECNSIALARTLLEYRADVNANWQHNSPLHCLISSWSSSAQGVSMLMSFGAHVNSTNAVGDTPLHLAIVANKRDCIEQLVIQGADVNLANVCRDPRGCSSQCLVDYALTAIIQHAGSIPLDMFSGVVRQLVAPICMCVCVCVCVC